MDGHHVPLGHTFGVSIRWSRGTHPWLPRPDAGIHATGAGVLRLLEEEWSCASNLPPVGRAARAYDREPSPHACVPLGVAGISCPYALVTEVGVHFDRHLDNSGPQCRARLSAPYSFSNARCWASCHQPRAKAQHVLVCRLASFLDWTSTSTGSEALRLSDAGADGPLCDRWIVLWITLWIGSRADRAAPGRLASQEALPGTVLGLYASSLLA